MPFSFFESSGDSAGAHSPAVADPEDHVWKRELSDGLRTAESLHRGGFIDEKDLPAYRSLLARYRFLLPPYYAGLIDRSDPNCPIRRQAIPDLRELRDEPQGNPDPLRDLDHQAAARITHRYRNRALIHLTPNCSMYCRYCFRKSLLNELSDDLFRGPLEAAVSYVARHSEIQEVIFSGGDPLLAPEETLGTVITELARLPHLRRLRFHTRCPTTLPSRITRKLARVLTEHGLPKVVGVHFNHPKEITEPVRSAFRILLERGITLLNQSVLLRGVNDDAEVLSCLSESLFSAGVLPYYLHHPDPAQGTGHFWVTQSEGLSLYAKLREALPGYLVPRYVWDDGSRNYKCYVGESPTRE